MLTRRLARSALATAGLLALALGAPPIAAAQDAAPQVAPPVAAPVHGPLVVEQIKDRYVLAPEAKVTQFDDTAAALVGGYGGILLQGAVLVGGGVYTMPDGPNDSELTYGGLVVGVLFGGERRFSYGVRGLVGIGTSELSTSIRFGVPNRPMPRSHGDLGGADAIVRDVRFDETFAVVEPQAEAAVRLSDNWRLSFGVGYRFTNASDFTNDRINGVTGTVAIVFGSGR